MEHLGPAWSLVSRNLVGWLIWTLALVGLIFVTFGLWALFLGPNVYLAAKRAGERGGAPSIGDLFDLSHLGDYIVYMLILFGIGVMNALVGAFCVCFVVITIPVGLLLPVLLFWVPMLLADGACSASDAVGKSFRAVQASLGGPLVFVVVSLIIQFVASLPCGLGLLVSVPTVTVAGWLYYQAERERILAA